MGRNKEFTESERARLNDWFPLNDVESQSVMWRMILDQRAENSDANVSEMVAFERDLQTAARLNYCTASMPGRFVDFYRAMGLSDSERSMQELSRLGDPTFIEPARNWARQKMSTATGGVRVKLGWRQALKHVLAMFGDETDEPPNPDPPVPDPEPPDDPERDRERVALWDEIKRLEAEYEKTKDALEIARNTFREERMTWEAERAALIAERDELRSENARLRIMIQPPDPPRNDNEKADDRDEIKAAIIAAMTDENLNIARACAKYGVRESTVYSWRKADIRFGSAIQAILDARRGDTRCAPNRKSLMSLP